MARTTYMSYAYRICAITFALFFSLTFQSFSYNGNADLLQPTDTTQLDRDYTLEAFITGYVGVGGKIDGIKNPTLVAEKGDLVRITMIN